MPHLNNQTKILKSVTLENLFKNYYTSELHWSSDSTAPLCIAKQKKENERYTLTLGYDD